MARRFLGLAALLLAFGPLAVVPALGQQKGQPPADPDEIDSDKLNAGTFVGRLKGGVKPGEDFQLEIDYQRLEVNPKFLQGAGQQAQALQQAQQQMVAAQARIAQAGTPLEQAKAVQAMRRTLAQLKANQRIQQTAYKIVLDTKEIEFHAADDLVIRRSTPPLGGFDQKGNLKAPTAAELRALKGPNPRLPGYAGKLEDLKPGSVVQVVMKRAVADPRSGEKAEHKNIVTLIVHEEDPPATPSRGK